MAVTGTILRSDQFGFSLDATDTATALTDFQSTGIETLQTAEAGRNRGSILVAGNDEPHVTIGGKTGPRTYTFTCAITNNVADFYHAMEDFYKSATAKNSLTMQLGTPDNSTSGSQRESGEVLLERVGPTGPYDQLGNPMRGEVVLVAENGMTIADI